MEPPRTEDVERWSHIKSIFQEAFEQAPDQRVRFLDAACRDDAELRASVERLLDAHQYAGSSFLDSFNEKSGAVEGRDPEGVPARIGTYRVIRELGRGGMGAVYLAERDDPALRKTVAIKVVRVESPLMLRRFQTETRILAGLEHSGIARLYDGGTTDDGLPYFVMEYVPGESLLAYCEAHALSTVERVRLFRRV